jgi:hypothetical protein
MSGQSVRLRAGASPASHPLAPAPTPAAEAGPTRQVTAARSGERHGIAGVGEEHRCGCGQPREACVRAAVRLLWAPAAGQPGQPPAPASPDSPGWRGRAAGQGV